MYENRKWEPNYTVEFRCSSESKHRLGLSKYRLFKATGPLPLLQHTFDLARHKCNLEETVVMIKHTSSKRRLFASLHANRSTV